MKVKELKILGGVEASSRRRSLLSPGDVTKDYYVSSYQMNVLSDILDLLSRFSVFYTDAELKKRFDSLLDYVSSSVDTPSDCNLDIVGDSVVVTFFK